VTVRREDATEIDLVVEAERVAVVVLRDAYDPGWSARVDGIETTVLRADGRYRAVVVPAGRSEVLLSYRPAGLTAGLLAALAAAAVVAALALRPPAWKPAA
jgi:uncharacterized membrane protein YfhO